MTIIITTCDGMEPAQSGLEEMKSKPSVTRK